VAISSQGQVTWAKMAWAYPTCDATYQFYFQCNPEESLHLFGFGRRSSSTAWRVVVRK